MLSVSIEAAVIGTVVYGEEENEEKRLCLFGNSMSIDFFNAFLDYELLSGNNNIVRGSFLQLSRLYA